MKCAVQLAIILLGVVSAEHPIVKVIGLLKGLKEDAITQGKTEAVANTKFEYWCSTTKAELKDAIAEEKETISELEDQLAGLKKDKETLEGEISTLDDQIKDLDSAAADAKKLRGQEAGNYKNANSKLTSTIKAMGDCITALSGAESKTESLLSAQRHVKMALSLISLKATETERQTLEEFADPKKRPNQLAKGDLNAHVDKYDFKSENVVELIKQLKLKFEDDKLAGTKAETAAVNAYDLAKRSRDNARKAAVKSRKKKNTELGQTNRDIKDANKNLKNTNNDLRDDSKSLNDTNDSCRIKKSEWDERSQTRSLEIEAMDQAMKILSSSTGVRTDAPGNPVPPASPSKVSYRSMFLQLSQVSTDPKMKALELLKQAAVETHSRALDRLAVEVAAHLNGPFDAVNNMIEKMIFRLMDEQKQEDEHKHWCDQEIEKTKVMEDDKEAKIKDLKAEIKVEKAAVGTLDSEITAAEEMIADITAFVNEATEIRNTGKSENNQAIKDSKQAQTALTNAIAVLESFYKESGEIKKEPWEFIQAPVGLGKKPSTWATPYTGVKGSGGKIISVLEAVQGDFEKMEAETKSQEAQDQKAFEDELKANAIQKADRKQQVEMKTSERARRNEKITTLESQKKDTEGELEKTVQYLDDLQKPCVSADSKYTDRKAARTKEIKALKTAQQTLLDAFNEKAGKKFLQISAH